MKIIRVLIIIIPILICGRLLSQTAYDDVQGASSVEVYKSVDDVDLRLWFFNPEKTDKSIQRPAIIFFFGGGWAQGTPNQFKEHSEYLAARGMIAILADYRVSKRHRVKAEKCVADAKSAIRYLRKNALRLGLDPNKIVSAGGSAGGHLGASVAILPGHNDLQDDTSISCKPNASVLFNPVLVTDAIPEHFETKDRFSSTLQKRFEGSLSAMSPYHHVTEGIGPMLVFHGTADKTVPFVSAKLFVEKMKELGNQCTLVEYDGEGHGFFNYGKKSNGPYIDTVKRMDDFLVAQGLLEATPKIRIH